MKKVCPKCQNSFTTKGNNYTKHINSCNGVYKKFVKSSCCKYCFLAFNELNSSERANHSRWCQKNPKRDILKGTGKQLNTPKAIEKRSVKISEAHANGKYKNAGKKCTETKKLNGTLTHSEETKQKIREKALQSKHRRVLRSTREYVKKDGSIILLDSSWEEALAKRLDFLNVEWIRPEPIEWIDNSGKKHNYFPDFYLPLHDVYLDPKNQIVMQLTKEKVEKIVKLLPNLKILSTLEECVNYNPPLVK